MNYAPSHYDAPDAASHYDALDAAGPYDSLAQVQGEDFSGLFGFDVASDAVAFEPSTPLDALAVPQVGDGASDDIGQMQDWLQLPFVPLEMSDMGVHSQLNISASPAATRIKDIHLIQSAPVTGSPSSLYPSIPSNSRETLSLADRFAELGLYTNDLAPPATPRMLPIPLLPSYPSTPQHSPNCSSPVLSSSTSGDGTVWSDRASSPRSKTAKSSARRTAKPYTRPSASSSGLNTSIFRTRVSYSPSAGGCPKAEACDDGLLRHLAGPVHGHIEPRGLRKQVRGEAEIRRPTGKGGKRTSGAYRARK